MKKIALVICLTIAICTIAGVCAADLTNHDFGNFTMDIPKNASFVEGVSTNDMVSSEELDVDTLSDSIPTLF